MIKLQRANKPQFLQENEDCLRTDLLKAVQEYGGYKNIPKDLKEKLTFQYRHSEIKEALISSSYGKCAFCECVPSEGGNVEVEHFKPKSLYPECAFDWANLLPACRKCNGSKSDHDTEADPIINPFEEDPLKKFFYDGLKIKVSVKGGCSISQRTIEVCGLNSIRLWKPRSAILVSLYGFEDDIAKALESYVEAETMQKKRNRMRAIVEAIDRIEMLAHESEKYSAFCRGFLSTCDSYHSAKLLVQDVE